MPPKTRESVLIQSKIKPGSAAWIDAEGERLELNRSETMRLMLAYVKANEVAWRRWSANHKLI